MVAFSDHLIIQEVPFGSDLQKQSIDLRFAILRKPEGLSFSQEELDSEGPFHHIISYNGKEIVGCVILLPLENETMRMKQVAVATKFQNRQIGTRMMLFCEAFALEKKFSTLFCHARETAIPFYQKLGWEFATEETFYEGGLAHRKMQKKLNCGSN